MSRSRSRRRRPALLVAALALLALVLAAAPAAADSVSGTITTDPPVNVAVSPDGALVYVTTIGTTVTVIDTATGAVTGLIGVGNFPNGVEFAPDGLRAYVVNTSDNSVTVIDVAAGAAVGGFPTGAGPRNVAVSPDSGTVYVTNEQGSSVTVYDVGLGTVTTVAVGLNPLGVTVLPDGSAVYVSNTGDNSVSVIDAATLAVQTISVTRPGGIAASPDGTTVYAASVIGQSFATVDVATGTVVYHSVGYPPYDFAPTPDGAKLLTVTSGGVVNVLDTATFTVQDTFTVGVIAYDIAVSPDSLHAYVSTLFPHGVTVIDLDVVPTLAPPSAAPAGTVGIPYSFATARRGSPAPSYALTSGVLPPGLSLDTTTGLVSGTPAVGGLSSFSVTATSAAGSATVAYSVTVRSALAATGLAAAPVLALGLDLVVGGVLLLALRRRLSAAS